MSSNYTLLPDEVIVLKDESACHGGAAGYQDEVLLTSQNLVVVKKGMFGRTKGVHIFPLAEVKVYNDRAQTAITKTRNGLNVLEVHFTHGHETFTFRAGGKRKVRTWAARIDEVVTGRESAAPVSAGIALPGAELVADTLKDTVDVFRSRLGRSPASPSKVGMKCSACGAAVAGVQGQHVTCSYCDTTHLLRADH